MKQNNDMDIAVLFWFGPKQKRYKRGTYGPRRQNLLNALTTDY